METQPNKCKDDNILYSFTHPIIDQTNVDISQDLDRVEGITAWGPYNFPKRYINEVSQPVTCSNQEEYVSLF